MSYSDCEGGFSEAGADEEGVFVVEDTWNDILERYDIEGFGEIPVTALDDIAQNLFSDRTSDQRDDKVIEPDLITKARLEVSRRRNPSETVTIQEITAIVTRKRSYSFRKAVSASQKKVESRRSVIRAQRRPRAHSVPFKFKRKILDMFKHKDEVKSAPALPEKDTKFNCESPIMERKASFPVLTFALCCTQLFFAIFHSIDGKKPLVLPCYNTEPWRYLLMSLIPLDLKDYFLSLLGHLLSLLPVELYHGTRSTLLLYFLGVFSYAVLATLKDCRSSVLGGNGGAVTVATALFVSHIGRNGAPQSDRTQLKAVCKIPTIMSTIYMSLEVGLSIYRSVLSSSPVCHCHFIGILPAIVFSNAIFGSNHKPLCENRLFLSTVVIYTLIGISLVMIDTMRSSPTKCILFHKKQVLL